MKKKALVMLLVGAMLAIGGCGSTKVENTDAVKETVEEAVEPVEDIAEDVQVEESHDDEVATLPLENEEYPVETDSTENIVKTAIDNFYNNKRVMIIGNVVMDPVTETVLPGFIACNRDTGIEYMLSGTEETPYHVFLDDNTSIGYLGIDDVWFKILPTWEKATDSALVDQYVQPYIETTDSFEVTDAETDDGAPYYRATCNYVDEAGDKYLVAISIDKDELLPFGINIYEVQDEATIETDEATITGENFINPVTSFEISYSPEDDASFDEMTILPTGDDIIEMSADEFRELVASLDE